MMALLLHLFLFLRIYELLCCSYHHSGIDLEIVEWPPTKRLFWYWYNFNFVEKIFRLDSWSRFLNRYIIMYSLCEIERNLRTRRKYYSTSKAKSKISETNNTKVLSKVRQNNQAFINGSHQRAAIDRNPVTSMGRGIDIRQKFAKVWVTAKFGNTITLASKTAWSCSKYNKYRYLTYLYNHICGIKWKQKDNFCD